MAKKKIKDLNTKLTEADRERKSAKATLVGAERQVEDQHQQLHRVEEQMVWIEALNLAEVDASSNLRKTENIFYLPTLRVAAQSTSQLTTTFQALPPTEPSDADATSVASELAKEKETKHSNPPPTASTDPQGPDSSPFTEDNKF
nr:hypothetical protein CFP56_05650 [Quercus suber]